MQHGILEHTSNLESNFNEDEGGDLANEGTGRTKTLFVKDAGRWVVNWYSCTRGAPVPSRLGRAQRRFRTPGQNHGGWHEQAGWEVTFGMREEVHEDGKTGRQDSKLNRRKNISKLPRVEVAILQNATGPSKYIMPHHTH